MFTDNAYIPFSFNMPIYNWFYPMSYREIKVSETNINKILRQRTERVKYRALYFHIPFCQDICAFCPFTREVLKDDDYLDRYVESLINEIELKASYPYITNVPISAIFVGGGTPSILKPKHIRKIGEAIRKNFDLSNLKEFSFEMNAKTVLPDKIKALKEIGVTHARMGVQTFNPKYREIFSLTATIENIHDGVNLLNNNFEHVCIDMLYGMHGEGVGEIVKDINTACELKTTNIDVYPINNGVIQSRLRKKYSEYNLTPLSGLDKYIANRICNELLETKGYLPHNGHGYYKSKHERTGDIFVDQGYTFEYHEAVYGYSGHEVVGFGVAAFSVFNEYLMGNVGEIDKYMKYIDEGKLPLAGMGEYEKELTDIKGLVLHLPYHGIVEKEKIDFDKLDNDLLKKIEMLKDRKLINEDDKNIWLTKDGWCNYVNLLYYLSPQKEQDILDNYIEKAGLIEEFKNELLFD